MKTKGYVTVTGHKGQQRINMAVQGVKAKRVVTSPTRTAVC